MIRDSLLTLSGLLSRRRAERHLAGVGTIPRRKRIAGTKHAAGVTDLLPDWHQFEHRLGGHLHNIAAKRRKQATKVESG